MIENRVRPVFASASILLVLLCCRQSQALIVGRDAESRAAELEKQGKFKEAAVWRLAAARAFEEMIIPFEVESVRAYTQAGKTRLAKICAGRAEVKYPKKVRSNLRLYKQNLEKAGGESVREGIEKKAAEILSKFAPIPITVPSRLKRVEQEERRGNWYTAADYREISARMFLQVTVPFFAKERDKEQDAPRRKHFQEEVVKYLRLAQDNFAKATDNYTRAAKSDRRSALCKRKALETQEQADSVTARLAVEERRGK